MDREKVLKLLQMLKASAATELEVERDGLRIKLSRPLPQPAAAAEPQAEEEEAPGLEASAEGALITSHVVGFFRRSGQPGGEVLAQPGQQVKQGQPLAAIQALSRWVLIESPIDAEVIEFLMEDGERAEYGSPLVRLRPLPGED